MESGRPFCGIWRTSHLDAQHNTGPKPYANHHTHAFGYCYTQPHQYTISDCHAQSYQHTFSDTHLYAHAATNANTLIHRTRRDQ